MRRKRFVLVWFLTERSGIRLWRTDRERNSKRLAALADWEVSLLADRRRGRFLAW
ncbi:hypothetical protein [Microbacterium sp. MMO-10]|uniref:hypothetical protein n=1 Tax=Microbacterium sp. MMO-10 TaxID=3081272 RepID=UPI00301A2A64